MQRFSRTPALNYIYNFSNNMAIIYRIMCLVFIIVFSFKLYFAILYIIKKIKFETKSINTFIFYIKFNFL